MRLPNLASPSSRVTDTADPRSAAIALPHGRLAAATAPGHSFLGRLTRPSQRASPGLRTRAAAPGAAGTDDSLVDALARHGFVLPAEHVCLGLQDTIDIRAALDHLARAAVLHRSSLRRLMRSACVDGYGRHLEPVLLLMQRGILDPNLRDRNGETFLHALAAEADDGLDFTFGYLTVSERVAALARAGADVNAVSHSQQLTPLDVALWREEPAVVDALLAAGASQRGNARDPGKP